MQDPIDKPKVPGPPPLSDLLEVGMEAEIEKEENERLGGKSERFPLSPSKFGGCARELAIGLAEFCGLGIYPNEKLDARAKRRFTRGYDIEYSLLKQFKQYVPMKQGFGQQYLSMAATPDAKYIIGGSLDTLFMSDEHMIVDIKSKATFYSSFRSDSFDETFSEISKMEGVRQFGDSAYFIEDIDTFYDKYNKDDFLSRYFLQLNAYGACDWAVSFKSNNFPNTTGISAVALLFENKNNHKMAELRWKPSRKLYDFAIKRMLDIYQHVVLDKKPAQEYPADFSMGTLACKLCSRREVCYPGARHPFIGEKKVWPKDTDRLYNGAQLEALYKKYKPLLQASEERAIIESELCTAIENTGSSKVRFSDGETYEIKVLKSPYPHLELRRSK